MNLLVFNCGSSSLNYKVFEFNNNIVGKVLLHGKAHRVGVQGSAPSYIEHFSENNAEQTEISIKNHAVAGELILKYLGTKGVSIKYIGHRFVHGGNYFNQTSLVNSSNLEMLRLCLPLAPIHNPISFSVIRKCIKYFPQAVQYVTFDTTFHTTIPYHIYTYCLPKRVIKKYGFRKYGFHGLSYSYVSNAVASNLNKPLEKLKMVLCHLGTGGSSVAAVQFGKSMDTSMGYSPLSGLMMSTRSGDIDPMLAVYLMTVYGYRPESMEDILNKKSGILGVSGFSGDIRDVIWKYNKDEKEQSEIALKMYVSRLKKYIGAYITALGGIDALAFTDDIGVGNPLVREKVCENMEWAGVSIDRQLNNKVRITNISQINSRDSKVRILSVPTNEELVIALEGEKLIRECC